MFILAAVLLHEKIRRVDIAALMCTFLGVVVVALRGFSQGFSVQSGDILVLAGALMYATGSVVFKKKLHTLHPEIVLFVRGLTAITFFFLISPFVDFNIVSEVRAFPFVLIGALLGYGFISRFMYLFTYYEAVERLPIHTISIALPLISVGSILFSHIVLGEVIAWFHVIGAALIIGGTVLMQMSHKKRKSKHVLCHERHHRHHI